MKKMIPYEKLSKKEKRKADAAKRKSWGEIDPVTRRPQNSKAYNRTKARSWKREMYADSFGSYYSYCYFPLLYGYPLLGRS